MNLPACGNHAYTLELSLDSSCAFDTVEQCLCYRCPQLLVRYLKMRQLMMSSVLDSSFARKVGFIDKDAGRHRAAAESHSLRTIPSSQFGNLYGVLRSYARKSKRPYLWAVNVLDYVLKLLITTSDTCFYIVRNTPRPSLCNFQLRVKMLPGEASLAGSLVIAREVRGWHSAINLASQPLRLARL